jgi:dTDP-4-amino-4,6-dideoxygalactose transaminase
MQFIDLASQQKRIRNSIELRLKAILDHGRYINGPEIEELENKLATYTGVPHALGVSSGTDALIMPLMVHDVGPGDAIFCPSFTFAASAEVVAFLKAVPILVDVDPQTFNMDLEHLKARIAQVRQEGLLKPRGILGVDLFGQIADYEGIQKIADREGLFVIEDAAQSFGAQQRGRKAGAMAEIAATSFFPAKPLGGYGDGGMIFCQDADMLRQLKSIREHGFGADRYVYERIGINGRLDSFQAAVLLAKMEIFEEEMDLRQQVAKRYETGLDGLVDTPLILPGNRSAWAQYTIKTDRREHLRKVLGDAGIPTAIYYPIPLHEQPVYQNGYNQKGACPVSEVLCSQVMSLPFHPYLGKEDQERICEAVAGALKS